MLCKLAHAKDEILESLPDATNKWAFFNEHKRHLLSLVCDASDDDPAPSIVLTTYKLSDALPDLLPAVTRKEGERSRVTLNNAKETSPHIFLTGLWCATVW